MTTVRERGLQMLRQHLEEHGWRVRESVHGRLKVLVVDRAGMKRQIRVPTKSAGTWQTSITNKPFTTNPHSDWLWAFIDTSRTTPGIHILPKHVARTAIKEGHEEYLARHSGRRAETNDSTHFAMYPRVVNRLTREHPVQWD